MGLQYLEGEIEMRLKQAKGFILGLVTATMIFALSFTALGVSTIKTLKVEYGGISIYVDGTKINPKDANGNAVEPFIYNGTTYLPARAIADALNNDIKWDESTKTVHITSKVGSSSTFPIGGSSITSSISFPLHLYSNDVKTYLGKLVTDEYDLDSIYNKYGDYGNEYNLDSIWNEYGTYGSAYSNESAFNKYANKPPKIIDNKGKLVGYLTANTTIDKGYTITELRQFLEDNYQ
jgi:hypothetical protein